MCWFGYLFVEDSRWQEQRAPIMGYDPRDLLSGHYIRFQIDKKKMGADFDNLPKELKRPQRFYVPQFYARQLSEALISNKYKFEVSYRMRENRPPRIKDIYIDGVLWREQIDKINAK